MVNEVNQKEQRENASEHKLPLMPFPVSQSCIPIKVVEGKERDGGGVSEGMKRGKKKKCNPQKRGCKEQESDKAGREGEVVNEDCIAVATRLIGFHFVFRPRRLSAFLSLLFCPLSCLM